jgi:hypothetical protein
MNIYEDLHAIRDATVRIQKKLDVIPVNEGVTNLMVFLYKKLDLAEKRYKLDIDSEFNEGAYRELFNIVQILNSMLTRG